MKDIVLYLVIPCYNEEEVLPVTIKRLAELLDNLISKSEVSKESRIVFVDDGSTDNTWSIIESAYSTYTSVRGIKLAANVGHQNALMAGLAEVKGLCDCCISIDADLQDDITVIPQFLNEYRNGCDVVYGVRKRRESDTAFKRGTAKAFYKLMRLLGADIIENHADYRLLSRRALNALAEFSEVNLFLRGMIRLVGFKSGVVYYDRTKRYAGESKYPLRKMLSFAFDGITSFSIKPIRIVWALGVLVSFIAVLAEIYTLCARFFGVSVTGWSSLMISIWFLGGVQLISVGVIGEYIGKIYKEVKHRPRYIIEKGLEDKK